jgi:hypothetical protein
MYHMMEGVVTGLVVTAAEFRVYSALCLRLIVVVALADMLFLSTELSCSRTAKQMCVFPRHLVFCVSPYACQSVFDHSSCPTVHYAFIDYWQWIIIWP